MSFTAKSIILDIADNHGSASYMGIRQIDFWFEGSKLLLVPTDYTAYATSQYSTSFLPGFSFDTSLSKTGVWENNQWLSQNGIATNQRLICVFNTSITFDRIRINNSHHNGSYTTAGAKNVKIHSSTDAITDTTYDATIANSTVLFADPFRIHVASNTEDEEILWISGDPLPDVRVTQQYTEAAITAENRNARVTQQYTEAAITAENPNARVTQQYTEAAITAENPNARITQQYVEVATVVAPPLVDTPVIVPTSGEYVPSQVITITCDTPSSTIYYTIDGSDPDNTDTEYTVPISVFTGTLKAIAVASGMTDSEIAAKTYRVVVHTPKSVILDIADNWGDPSVISLRSVDFYDANNDLIPITAGMITAYATSTLTGFDPSWVFITSLSRTGEQSGTQWSSDLEITAQRLICVFDTPVTVSYIVVNNSHHNGSNTTAGAKNVTITLSTDNISDTTYDAAVANSMVFFDSELLKHAESDIVDAQLIMYPSERTDIPAKSVIFDITDNYGYASLLSIRSIDFYKDQDKIIIDSSNCLCYATTENSANFLAEFAFYSNKFKTEGNTNNAWVSSEGGNTNQRLIIIFNSAIAFDSIAINNAHTGSFETDLGAQNVVINISSDVITDTTFNAAISNATEIFDGVFVEHSSEDAVDFQILAVAGYTPTVALPVFYPASGTYPVETNIVLTCSTPGSVLHYTVDGSTPTISSPVYSAPIAIFAGTLKAIAVATGYLDSAVVSETYAIGVGTSSQPRVFIIM